ncbi:MAG TPA: hypothetical protein VKY24_12085, partial [Reyranella sp.]|nr:hypothetical protein [Reyranella sp.]
AAIERCLNSTPFHRFKPEQVRDTLCLHRGIPLGVLKTVAAQQLSQSLRPDAPNSVRYPG